MQAQQRIWIASELYYPELTSTGYFMTGIAEGLAATYDVSVLCGQPSYWERGKRAPSQEVHHHVKILRSRGGALNKDRLLSRLFNLVAVSASAFVSAVFRFRRGDVAIVVTNPPLLPYLITAAARLRGARVILLIHDVYPEVLFRLGMVKPQSLAARVMNHASLWLYRKVDRILVLGRDMRSLLLEKTGLPAAGILVATNWGNTDVITPQAPERTKLLTRLNLSDKFIVQFYGNMGRPHGIEDLINAAELLRDSVECHFLLIGWGAKKEWAISEKARRGLGNLTIIDPLPREDSCDTQNACHLAINTLAVGMRGISVPSRTYNVLAAGKPLIAVCEEGSELAMIVQEEGVGWVVPPGHPELIAEAVRAAMDDRSRLRSMGERARQAADKKYTQRHVVSVYQDVISELVQPG